MSIAYANSSESHTGTTGSTSQASFTWNHTPTGTPTGVVVFVFQGGTNGSTNASGAVTYGGVNVPEISGAVAVDTTTELGQTKAYFLGSGVPSGTQAVVVNRTNNTTTLYAVAVTITSTGTGAPTIAGVTVANNNAAIAQTNIDDGKTTGTQNSLRMAGVYYGGTTLTAGANTTSRQNIVIGSTYCFYVGTETTPGIGSRAVGFTNATSDDRAAVYFAIIENNAPLSAGQNSITISAPSATVTASTPATVLSAGQNSITVTAPTARVEITVPVGTNTITATASTPIVSQPVTSYSQLVGSIANGVYRVGPFYYNNNYYYLGGVHADWANYERIAAVKVGHGTSVTLSSVTECDAPHSPNTNGGYPSTQIYAVHNGTTIHVIYADGTNTVKYATFDMATELWSVAETVLSNVGSLSIDTISLAYRDTSNELIFGYGISGTGVYYARRTGSGWSTGNVVYNSSYVYGQTRTFAVGERVFIFYSKDSGGGVVGNCVRVLSASNTLGTEVTLFNGQNWYISGGSAFTDAVTSQQALLVAATYTTGNGGTGAVTLYKLTSADVPTVTSIGTLGSTLDTTATHIIGDKTANRVLIVSPDNTTGSKQGLYWIYDTINGLHTPVQINSGQTAGFSGNAYVRAGAIRSAFLWAPDAFLNHITELTIGTIEAVAATNNPITVSAPTVTRIFSTPITVDTNSISVSAPTATVTRSTLRIELRHASGSVLIASWTVEPSENWEQYTYTLTQPEFEAISDWADIQLWLVANGKQMQVAWAGLATPAAATQLAFHVDNIAIDVSNPSVSFATRKTIAAGTNSILITAPAIRVSQKVPITTNTLTVSAPTVNVWRKIPTGSNSITVSAPTITVSQKIPVGVNSIIVSANDIRVTQKIPVTVNTVVVTNGAIKVSQFIPVTTNIVNVTASTVKVSQKIPVTNNTIIVTNGVVTVTRKIPVSVNTVTVSAPSIKVSQKIPATTNMVVLSANAVLVALKIVATNATVDISAPTIKVSQKVPVTPNSITSSAPNIKVSQKIPAASQTITITAASVRVSQKIPATAAQLTITAPVIKVSQKVPVAAQTISVSAPTIKVSQKAPVFVNSINITANAVRVALNVRVTNNNINITAPVASRSTTVAVAASNNRITYTAPSATTGSVITKQAGQNTLVTSAPLVTIRVSRFAASETNTITVVVNNVTVETTRNASAGVNVITAFAPSATRTAQTRVNASNNSITLSNPVCSVRTSRNAATPANIITVAAQNVSVFRRVTVVTNANSILVTTPQQTEAVSIKRNTVPGTLVVTAPTIIRSSHVAVNAGPNTIVTQAPAVTFNQAGVATIGVNTISVTAPNCSVVARRTSIADTNSVTVAATTVTVGANIRVITTTNNINISAPVVSVSTRRSVSTAACIITPTAPSIRIGLSGIFTVAIAITAPDTSLRISRSATTGSQTIIVSVPNAARTAATTILGVVNQIAITNPSTASVLNWYLTTQTAHITSSAPIVSTKRTIALTVGAGIIAAAVQPVTVATTVSVSASTNNVTVYNAPAVVHRRIPATTASLQVTNPSVSIEHGQKTNTNIITLEAAPASLSTHVVSQPDANRILLVNQPIRVVTQVGISIETSLVESTNPVAYGYININLPTDAAVIEITAPRRLGPVPVETNIIEITAPTASFNINSQRTAEPAVINVIAITPIVMANIPEIAVRRVPCWLVEKSDNVWYVERSSIPSNSTTATWVVEQQDDTWYVGRSSITADSTTATWVVEHQDDTWYVQYTK